MKALKNYKWGADLAGVLLFALLLLPYLVYWCIPQFSGLIQNKGLAVAAYFFGALGGAATVAIVRKDRRPFAFFSLAGTFTWLFTLLNYIAWIFYFCGYPNIAVVLFLAVCPGGALLAYQTERKNYVALAPTVLFTLLHFIAILLPIL